MGQNPSYYSNIPATVRYDKTLTANEKLMYGEITALSGKEGRAWATNNYFAELYDVHKGSVSRWISNLEKRGYIKVDLIYYKNSKQVKRRYLYINDTPIHNEVNTSTQKDNEGVHNKVKEVLNTTSNNTTSNNKTLVKEKEDVKKSKEDVKKKKSREFTFSDEQLNLAKFLLSKREFNYPNYKKPNLESWASDIRLMMEQDGRKKEHIKKAIEWSQSNQFWKENILSASSLRKQYDQMNVKAIGQGQGFEEDGEFKDFFDVPNEPQPKRDFWVD